MIESRSFITIWCLRGAACIFAEDSVICKSNGSCGVTRMNLDLDRCLRGRLVTLSDAPKHPQSSSSTPDETPIKSDSATGGVIP